MLAAAVSSAETLKGRVVFNDAPLAKAQVRVFGPNGALAGCPRTPGRPFGRCLCPEQQEAFGKRLLAGLEGAKPIATAVTVADGTFTVWWLAKDPSLRWRHRPMESWAARGPLAAM